MSNPTNPTERAVVGEPHLHYPFGWDEKCSECQGAKASYEPTRPLATEAETPRPKCHASFPSEPRMIFVCPQCGGDLRQPLPSERVLAGEGPDPDPSGYFVPSRGVEAVHQAEDVAVAKCPRCGIFKPEGNCPHCGYVCEFATPPLAPDDPHCACHGLNACPNQSSVAWREWFGRLGLAASVDVVNATANLVIAEREIYVRTAGPQSVWDEAIEIATTADIRPGWGSASGEMMRKEIIAQLTAARDRVSPPAGAKSTTLLLRKIAEICDAGSAQEFGDADERLRAIRGMIIGEAV